MLLSHCNISGGGGASLPTPDPPCALASFIRHARWFRGPLADFVENWLEESALRETGILKKEYLRTLVPEHRKGIIDHNFRIWNFLNWEIWYRLVCLGESREAIRQRIDRQRSVVTTD
jgi:hypothetical protein